MSLIEEALRKQALEEGQRSQPPISVAPDAHASPLFHPPAVSSAVIARPYVHPDSGQQRNFALMIAAGVGLLLLLAAFGTIFFVLSGGTRTGSSSSPPPTAAPSYVPVVRSPPAGVTRPLPAAATTTVTAVSVTKSSALPVVAQAVSIPGATHPVEIPVVAAPVAPEVPAAAIVAPILPTSPAASVVTWPELVIKGTFATGGKSLVLLNDGITLEAGTTAPNGVRLLDATSARVRVSYRDQVRTYHRVGGSFVAFTNESGMAVARP